MSLAGHLRQFEPSRVALVGHRRALLASLVAIVLGTSCTGRDPAALKADATRRGEAALAEQRYAEAIAAFREVVAHDPRDGRAQFRLAKAHVAAGDWAEAAAAAIIAADLLPGDREAQLFAMSMMLARGRFPDVADRASAMLKEEPGNPELLILWANATARLLNATWAMWKLDEAMRLGTSVEKAYTEIRPAVPGADDEAAHRAFRRALALAPADIHARLAVVNHLWAMRRLEDSEALLKGVADQSPNHAFANRALGAYYASRRHANAEKYLKAAAATGDRDARIALADLYATANRHAEGLALLDDLIASGDSTGDLGVRAADLELRLGRTTPALQRLDRILKLLPRHSRALELKAQVLFATRQIDLAAVSAEAAVDADPRSSTARRLFGRVLTARGDPDRAFDQFAEALRLAPTIPDVAREIAVVALALRRDEVALEYARQAIHRDPADRTATVVFVTALVGVSDYAGADKALRPLLAEEPNAPDLLLQLGRIHAGRGDRPAARAVYGRVLQAVPDSVPALSGLVSLDLAEGQAASARDRVNRARAQRPKEAGLLLLAARAAAAAGDPRDAEMTLRALRNLEPANVEAGVLFAEVLAGQNRPQDAKQVLDDVLKLRPASVEAQLALARLLEGTGQRVAAQATYERLLAAQPRTPIAAYRLASLYVAGNERLEQALELARGAKQALPDDPAVSDVLGWVYIRRGLVSLGLPHLQDAVRKVPTNAVYRYRLGVAYLRTGRPALARAELLRALEIDAAFPGADDARAILATLRQE